MRAQIEKAMALIRQGHSTKALHVLARVVQQLPPDLSKEDDTGEITLELAVPMKFPHIDIKMTDKGEHFLVVDEKNEWVIGQTAEDELQEICTPLRSLRYVRTIDVNLYKIHVAAKLKEMVLSERIGKR